MNKKNSTISASESARPPASKALSLSAARTFIAICETGSFRRAAARVNRSPSAVSLQVGKLEQQLGVRLLYRNARRVHLTEPGEVLLGFARRLIDISDEALATFHGSPLSGHLRLAAPHDLGVTLVPRILRRLAEAHPRVRVDVRLDSSDRVQKAFEDGSVHFALFNETATPRLPVRCLFSEPLLWMMREDGRAVQQSPLPLAVAEIGCAWRGLALQALEAADRSYRIAYSSDTSMGQVAALHADLAVAALPGSLAGKGLVEVPKHWGLPGLGRTHIYLADDGSEAAELLATLIDSTLYSPDTGDTPLHVRGR